MRALVVAPGPAFSVADVAAGWVKGLQQAGVDTRYSRLDQRLDFFSSAHIARNGEQTKAMTWEQAVLLSQESVRAEAFCWWPDIVVVISSFFVTNDTLDVLRNRGMKVVVVMTESPYEDSKQLGRAPAADLVLLNDPTNLERFRQVNPNTHYQWHCYDPDRHTPGPAVADLKSDFCFVGTLFPSRVEFFERIDWSGIDALFGGNVAAVGERSPLRPLLLNTDEGCVPNNETVDAYRSTKCSANLYRKEANDGDHAHGWAVGPREVELAACGTFFLREPRPEGDELFPMLPVFHTPEEFSESLRWWLAHDPQRDEAARQARAAVADRSFRSSAQRLLRLLNI